MHVRRLFVHVNDGGDDVLFADSLFEESAGGGEECTQLIFGQAGQVFRTGGDQRVDEAHAVLACPASGSEDTLLDFAVVRLLRLDDVEIIPASRSVDIRLRLQECPAWMKYRVSIQIRMKIAKDEADKRNAERTDALQQKKAVSKSKKKSDLER